MRHQGQIHEVEVALADVPLGEHELDGLRQRFTTLYERLYGNGSSLAGARLELVTARCRASAATPKPSLVKHEELTSEIHPEARLDPRSVYWPRDVSSKTVTGPPGRLDTPVYDGHRLRPGNRLEGPAIVELDTTTVVVHPGQALVMDAFANFELFPRTGDDARD